MAGELVSLGIQKLWNLLSQEFERFEGVEDQVNGLKSDLDWLTSFMEDAGAKKHTAAVVRTCIEKIHEIVYDAEDIVDTYLIKKKLGKTSGINMSVRRHACIIPGRRRYALDIGSIRTRISYVVRDMQSFGVQQVVVNGGNLQPHGDRQREMRQEFSREYESNFVGLEANVKKLVGYLVEEEDIQIVSVTGMGGLGKTTLARKVFNHEYVKQKFDKLAWVCVSQEFTRVSVWQTILQNLTSKERKDEILKMKEDELVNELSPLLESSKSLIVFDDIWKEADWDLLRPIFPTKKGWKVLLTSRNESVAARGGDTTYINFKPKCLSTEDSWTLFQRIAHPTKNASHIEVDVEMEEMGKQMIEHCGGLPLAIKVLGGLLAAKYTPHDWRKLSENIGSHLVGGRSDFKDGNNSSCNYVLSLSFEELPSYLKHCFLYLAHFPEDHKIEVERLSYYWAAERIFGPRHNDGETIKDVGDVHIEELVRRNMVISEREATTLRFETCHLHDMMREMCLLKAKEENFLQITNSSPPTANFQSRRYVSHDTIGFHFERDIKNPKLRSLMVFPRYELSGSSYTRLELLRVLDFHRAGNRGRKLAPGIGKLIHLRYLSLEAAEVSYIPSSLRNLKLLIYLNLRLAGFVFVPNVLMGMQELRYLELPWQLHKKTKLELSNLAKLETLINFSTGNSSVEDLRGMARLRTLYIILAEETSMETLSASIAGLRHLEDLTIQDSYARRTEESVVLDFINLRKLSLLVYMPRQPHFPSRLTFLRLTSCCLKEDPMPILEKLTMLKELKLEIQSFIGRKLVCSSGGFPQLLDFEIDGLDKLKEWIVEEGSMPLLHTLTIEDCPKLKELPDGLRFISSLKDLTVDMPNLKKRVCEGGEDYDKVKHIPSIKFI